jgi:hypothetical protein
MLNFMMAFRRCRHGLACAGVLLAAPVGAHAGRPADDRVLYRMAAAVVTAHEQPASFAVWDQPISGSAMTEARVPRHRADNQFVRAFPKMGQRLQSALLAPAPRGASPAAIAPFAMPAAGPAFLGFVDLPWIATHARENDNTRLIVGFSRIAYVGTSALLYAEACLATQDTACNGVAFWFRKTGSGWKLGKHVQLWGGGIQPFWDFTED